MKTDKKFNVKVGDTVEVHFLDHSEGCGDVEPISTILHGSIHKICTKHFVICAWDTPGECSSNHASYSIVKSCIEKMIVWVEGDVRYSRENLV